MPLLSLLRPARRKTVSLPIHPCVELEHYVSAKLCMFWDGDLSDQEGEALLDELYADPQTAQLARQITRDEQMLRSVFHAAAVATAGAA
jgi:hypothetical protein